MLMVTPFRMMQLICLRVQRSINSAAYLSGFQILVKAIHTVLSLTLSMTREERSFKDVFLVVQVPLPGTDFTPTIIGTEDKVINENKTVIFQIVATDDGLQDSLTFTLDNALPPRAMFDAQGTHIFEWATTFNDSGTYVLAFSATDSFPNTARDTVLITVNNVNRLPVTTIPTDTNFMEGTSIVLPLRISDPDNDTITCFEVPFSILIKSGGVDTLVWTSTFLQEGVYQLRFMVDDTQNGSLSHTIQITIKHLRWRK